MKVKRSICTVFLFFAYFSMFSVSFCGEWFSFITIGEKAPNFHARRWISGEPVVNINMLHSKAYLVVMVDPYEDIGKNAMAFLSTLRNIYHSRDLKIIMIFKRDPSNDLLNENTVLYSSFIDNDNLTYTEYFGERSYPYPVRACVFTDDYKLVWEGYALDKLEFVVSSVLAGELTSEIAEAISYKADLFGNRLYKWIDIKGDFAEVRSVLRDISKSYSSCLSEPELGVMIFSMLVDLRRNEVPAYILNTEIRDINAFWDSIKNSLKFILPENSVTDAYHILFSSGRTEELLKDLIACGSIALAYGYCNENDTSNFLILKQIMDNQKFVSRATSKDIDLCNKDNLNNRIGLIFLAAQKWIDER